MHFTTNIIASVLLMIIIGFMPGFAQQKNAPRKSGAAQSREVGLLTRVRERGGIVPLVDHHQHIVGPRAVNSWTPLSPSPELPPGLNRVIQERNRIMGTKDIGNLYTETARILDDMSVRQPWVQGSANIQRIVGSFTPKTRFIPQFFA